MTEILISIDHDKCQGCGSCVNTCPNGGFRVINGKSHVIQDRFCDGIGYCIQNCPMGAIKYKGKTVEDVSVFIKDKPFVNNWPIKLQLVNSKISQFKNAHLAVIADCVPLVYRNFKEIIKDRIILIVCPKIGNVKEIREKLMKIIEQNQIKSIVSYSVDYICCDGLQRIVKDAIRFSSKKDKLMPEFKHNVICLFGAKK
ncbi:MAG: ATP-binding protein [Promethearchaeota archaeon]